MFNYKGRMFIFELLSESIVSFLMKPSFRDVWTADQITTMVGPMRDMEYTFCYYAYYNAPLDQKLIHCRKSRGIFLVIAFFPNVLRMLQCIKMIIDSGNPFPQKYNILKFSLNLVVATCSFFIDKHYSLYYVWLFTSFISTCFSFIWDLKMDFGLLDKKHFPLREKLFYSSKIYYYFVGVLNFFLRFLWLITLSPEVINAFIRPETLSIILFTLEILRRGMWNCIRLEYKHLEISEEFRVCSNVELPFVKNTYDKYVPIESNIYSQMNLSKENMIKFQVEKLFGDNASKERIVWGKKDIPDYSEEEKVNNDEIRDYLDSYRGSTAENLAVGGSDQLQIKKISRKLN